MLLCLIQCVENDNDFEDDSPPLFRCGKSGKIPSIFSFGKQKNIFLEFSIFFIYIYWLKCICSLCLWWNGQIKFDMSMAKKYIEQKRNSIIISSEKSSFKPSESSIFAESIQLLFLKSNNWMIQILLGLFLWTNTKTNKQTLWSSHWLIQSDIWIKKVFWITGLKQICQTKKNISMNAIFNRAKKNNNLKKAARVVSKHKTEVSDRK